MEMKIGEQLIVEKTIKMMLLCCCFGLVRSVQVRAVVALAGQYEMELNKVTGHAWLFYSRWQDSRRSQSKVSKHVHCKRAATVIIIRVWPIHQ